jgi:hypothetical protein
MTMCLFTFELKRGKYGIECTQTVYRVLCISLTEGDAIGFFFTSLLLLFSLILFLLYSYLTTVS